MKKADPEFYTIANSGKWDVESMDATLMEKVDSFEVAQIIAQLACLGYLYANGTGEICLQEHGDLEALKESIDLEFEDDIHGDDGPIYDSESDEMSENVSAPPSGMKGSKV
jgi:hypothetical protein